MVVPVYKKDLRSSPSNNRPISLTSLACKVKEHIVVSHIYKHLNLYDIITNLQDGFRGSFSSETQLIMATHDWASVLNPNGQVDAIMLDFSKAFDRVSHAKLIHKLEHYGISGKLFCGFCDYYQESHGKPFRQRYFTFITIIIIIIIIIMQIQKLNTST